MGTEPIGKAPEELAELAKLCKEGERTAFDTLFAETSPWVTSIVLGILADRDLVEETVQDIYLLMWKNIHALDEPLAFLAWLKRIAVNRSLRRAETEKRKQNLTISTSDHSLERAPSPDQDVTLRMSLLQALRDLPPRERAVLVVRELHGASYQELSKLFAVPVGTIRSRLNSAKKKAFKFLTNPEKNHV